MTIRQHVEAEIVRRPFLLLIRHFAQRAVSGSDTVSDVDLGIGSTLAILAVPGAFTSLALMGKYSSLIQWLRGLHLNPYRISVPDEYFFIVYSMAITGLVTLLRWDHLLPRRRDYANLAPLPLKLRSIFLANVAALSLIALIFAMDVNAVSCFLFPMLVTYQAGTLHAFLEFAIAHVLATIGISLFTFLGLLGAQGLLMAFFPGAVYRRVALVVRTILLIFFFGLLISAFLLPISVLNFRFGSHLAGNWWPPMWFLSVFERLIGELRHQSRISESLGLIALAAAFGVAVLGFALSYSRHFLRIPETPEGPFKPSPIGRLSFDRLRPVLGLCMKPGPETASLKFIFKTLTRNETHLLFFGIWAGIGLLLSLEAIAGTRGAYIARSVQGGALIAAPLIFAYAIVAGLRFIFDIPAVLEANWVFRLAAAGPILAPKVLARKTMAIFVLPWLLGVWLPVAGSRLGWEGASLACAAHCLFLLVGIDLALMGYRKIPFTCSFTADRDRMLKLLLISFFTIVTVIPLIVSIESAIVKHPWKIVLLAGAAAGVCWFIRNKAEEQNLAAVYEDRGAPEFALLHLSAD